MLPEYASLVSDLQLETEVLTGLSGLEQVQAHRPDFSRRQCRPVFHPRVLLYIWQLSPGRRPRPRAVRSLPVTEGVAALTAEPCYEPPSGNGS